MIQDIERADGTKISVPFIGPRFDHYDIDKDVFSMRFQKINGWSILEALVPIIVYHRPYPIVEIGAGSSTFYLARVAEQFHVKLYSCDKSPRKNKVYFKDHIFVQKFSGDFMAEFTDWPVSVVLIDADHRYEVAKMEFDFFYDKLIPGGVIFLHDTMPPAEEYLTDTACSDVYRLRQELEKRDNLECITYPYTAGFMGLTQIIKKDPNYRYWEQ